MNLVSPRQSSSMVYALVALMVCGFAVITFAFAWTTVLPPVFGTPLLRDTGVALAMLIGLLLGILYARAREARLREGSRIFGLFEIGTAASGFVAFIVISRMEGLYAALSGGFHGAALASLGGFVLVLAVLLVPTFLMGVTLCLGCNMLARRWNSFEAGGHFYAVLCLGIAVGAGLSGFILMPGLGAERTSGIAALAVVAMGFVSMAGRGSATDPASASDPADGGGSEAGRPGSFLVPVVLAHLLYISSGVACALIWTRFLAQVVGKTVYLGAAMLTVFAGAAAIGSFASARAARRASSPSFWLGLVSALTGVVWLLPFFFVNKLPFAFLRFFSLAPRISDPEWSGLVLSYFALCFILMFVPGLLLGSALPLALKALIPGRRLSLKWFGLSAAVVILGTLVAIIASLLVPRTGLTVRRVLIVLPWIAIAAGYVHIFGSERIWKTRLIIMAFLAASALVPSIFSPPWSKGILTSGLYTNPGRSQYVGNLEAALTANDVPFFEEGPDEVVSIVRSPDGIFLRADGRPVQSSTEDLTAQMLSAHIPLMLKDNPKRVLVVGLGSGISAGAALAYDLSEVDCIEPRPARVRACRFFAPYNQNALQDSRLHLVCCDPSNYLLLSQKPYDVIICEEPVLPRGFVRLARARLGGGGVVAQVVNLQDIAADGFKAIAKEFAYYFPYVDLWWCGGTELLLVATLQSPEMSAQTIGERMTRQGARSGLLSLGIADQVGMLACYMMSREALLGLAGETSMNSVDRSPLVYLTPRKLAAGDEVRALTQIDSASENAVSFLPKAEPGSAEYALIRDGLERCMNARASYFKALAASRDRKMKDALKSLAEAKGLCPSNGIFQARLSDFYVALSRVQAEANQLAEAINTARRAIDESPLNYRAFYCLANLELRRDPKTAAMLLRRATEINPDYIPAYLLKAEAEIGLGDIDQADDTVAKVISMEPLNPRAHHLRALCFTRRGMLEDARRDLDFVLKADPGNGDVLGAIAYTWLLQNDLGKGQKFYERALRANPTSIDTLNNLATVLAERGNYLKAIRLLKRALELDPGNPDIKRNLEDTRQKAGQS